MNLNDENLINDVIVEDKTKKTTKQVKKSTTKEVMYYDIQCIDNGSGIPPDQVGDLLGRVLSGSKHGVKQTRGKFGLGAKMVTISLFSFSFLSLCYLFLM